MESVDDLFWYIQDSEEELESIMENEEITELTNILEVSPLYHFMGEYWN